MRILSSTYLELHEPAQFPEGSTEGPLSIIQLNKKLKSGEKRTTPDYFSISVKFGPISMRIKFYFYFKQNIDLN